MAAPKSPSRPRLVLGTANRKKAGELADLLVLAGFECFTLADFPPSPDVDETGSSFAENAAIKAREQAQRTRHWVLADDTGLVVDALGGAAGLYSARYA